MSRSGTSTELLLQKQLEQELVRLLRMVKDILIWWNSTYDMILRAKCIRFPLRDWLDEQILNDPSQERLSLSNLNWKKLDYLIILLHPFAEYTSLIGNSRDATINHTWNVYNCVYNYIIIYTPFPYPKLCPYPKPTQQYTYVGTPKDPTNQIAAHNLRAPIKPRPAGPRANPKPKQE